MSLSKGLLTASIRLAASAFDASTLAGVASAVASLDSESNAGSLVVLFGPARVHPQKAMAERKAKGLGALKRWAYMRV